jgi:hypothetical protein
MRKTLAILVTAAGIGALAVMAPTPADAGEFGIEPASGLIVGAVEVSPYYDGYIYGPLPYGQYYDPRVYYGPHVYHGSRVYHGPRVHRSSRIRHVVARIHHVRRVTRVFDPYAGGGPFYHHHYCCRYW